MTERTESRDPSRKATLKRHELFELHSHYEVAAMDELDFFLRYLNFYVGLLSAILAVTLTGLLSLSRSSLDPVLKLTLLTGLLTGPILTITLSRAGYPILKVYWRRFAQAWVTGYNIRAMLGLRGSILLDEGIRPPLYTSKYDNGFIAQFDAKEIPPLKPFRDAAEKKWSSEKLLNKLAERNDQLRMAKRILIAFGVAAIGLCVVITIVITIIAWHWIQSLPN